MANFLAKFLWKLWGWHLFYMEKYKEKRLCAAFENKSLIIHSYWFSEHFFFFFFFCLIKFAQTKWVWLDSCDWIKNVGPYRMFIYVGDVPSHVLCFWTYILMHNLNFWWLSSYKRKSYLLLILFSLLCLVKLRNYSKSLWTFYYLICNIIFTRKVNRYPNNNDLRNIF